MKATRLPVAACVVAMLLIAAYCPVAIHRMVVSNRPPALVYALGTVDRDVTYCDSQTMDLYVPDGGGVRPLAVFVHGGGLVSGDSAYLRQVFLDALSSAGYVVASVNYRLAPAGRFPAQIEDVKCAIRFLRAHAGDYRIDPQRVFAFGTSYGGTLADLLALTGRQSTFDAGPYLDEPSSVLAAVDMFGPADLPGWISRDGLRQIFGGDEAELPLASAVHYVAAGAPPILIIQGAEDTTVPPSQSSELYERLRQAGDPTQLVLVQHMGHMFAHVGGPPIDPGLPLIAQDMVRFFDDAAAHA